MVTPPEIGLVLVVAAILVGVFLLLKSMKPLIVNAVLGLIVLLVAGMVGFGVEITPIVVILVAFGGIPAAILVILLAYLGIIFQPAVFGIPVAFL